MIDDQIVKPFFSLDKSSKLMKLMTDCKFSYMHKHSWVQHGAVFPRRRSGCKIPNFDLSRLVHCESYLHRLNKKPWGRMGILLRLWWNAAEDWINHLTCTAKILNPKNTDPRPQTPKLHHELYPRPPKKGSGKCTVSGCRENLVSVFKEVLRTNTDRSKICFVIDIP